MPKVKIPVLGEESAHPSLNAAIVERDFACCRVKALTRLHRVSLDEVAKCKYGREAVSELHEANRCCHVGEAEEVRDRGGEDEGEGPVDWNNAGPEDLAAFREKGGRMEELHEDVVVDDFDADVAVQRGRNEATNDCKHVARNLPAIGRDALVCNLWEYVSQRSNQRRMEKMFRGDCTRDTSKGRATHLV